MTASLQFHELRQVVHRTLVCLHTSLGVDERLQSLRKFRMHPDECMKDHHPTCWWPTLRLVQFVRLEQTDHLHLSYRSLNLQEPVLRLSLIHISEPTRLLSISYAVFCLK